MWDETKWGEWGRRCVTVLVLVGVTVTQALQYLRSLSDYPGQLLSDKQAGSIHSADMLNKGIIQVPGGIE